MGPSTPSPSPAPEGPSAPASISSFTNVLLLAALAVLWGSAYIFIRQGLVLGASPLLYAGVRYALSAAAFVAIALVLRAPLPSRRELLVSLATAGVFGIAIYGAALYWGEQYTTGGYASVIASTAPILTVVAAYALLPQERPSWTSGLGIGVGFLGVIILVVPGLEGSPVGVWPGPAFLVLAFLSYAIGTVLLRRFARAPQGLWQLGGQFGLGAAVLLLAAQVVPNQEHLPLTAPVLESLLALVALASVAGYFVYFRLHHRVGPVRANIVAYLLPLVGLGIGTGLLGEPLSAWEIAGFLVVIVGVTLVLWELLRHPPVPSTAGR